MGCKNSKNIAIIGAGPAGCMCAYWANENGHNVTLFDTKPLSTILYTGGGRCNLAYSEFDFRELVRNYPRGEKFLYSIFSKFSTQNTIDFFKKIGIETYTQEDNRIFPVSNEAKDVKIKILNSLKNCQFIKEKIIDIKIENSSYILTSNRAKYLYDEVVIAIGGHCGFELVEKLGLKIIPPKPALTSLITDKKFPQGISFKNISADIFYKNKKILTQNGDLMFTHSGITGPLAFNISSYCARIDYNSQFPLSIFINFLGKEIDFQVLLNKNPKKDIKNLVSEFVPKNFVPHILQNISGEEKCCNINGKMRNQIYENLTHFKINVISPAKDGEIVTSGGVCLKEINPKTMQTKCGIYVCGEIIDVDGLCGGFNLQNCWSTGYIAGVSI